MPTIQEPTARPPIVPRLDPQERRARNAAAIQRLDEFAADPDDEDQRDAMAVLREALGTGRTISDRSAFRP